MSREEVQSRTAVTGRATAAGRTVRGEAPVDPLPGVVDFAFTANIPADNGLIISNPKMGIEGGYGLTSDLNLATAIGTVNAGAKTFTITSSNWRGGVAGHQYPHFTSAGVWVGVLTPTSVGDTTSYTIVSGSDPVSGGRIYNYDQDISLVRAKFSWREIESTKNTYDFAAIEISAGIKMVRELDAHGWGTFKYFILDLILDYPSDEAHRDIPDWLYTETGGDGVAYNADAYTKGYSPNYSNATFIAAHSRLLVALGIEYGDDPLCAGIMMGSLGHWGENWYMNSIHAQVPFPNNSVVEQYLDHYSNAFGDNRCMARRSMGTLGERGWGLYNHGMYSALQVYTYKTGGIAGFLVNANDDYGYAQVAIADYKARFKTAEPYGIVRGASTSYAFANEPTSLITLAKLNDQTEWEPGAFGTSVGSAITNVVNAKCYRQKNRVACAPNTTYRLRHQPGWSGEVTGYQVNVVITNSSDVLLSNTAVDDDATFTTGSTAAYFRCYAQQYRNTKQDMTHAMLKDAFPRVYLDSAGAATSLNIELAMKQINDYNMSAFSTKPYLWRTSGSVATEANTKRFFNRIGYRIRPIAASLSGADLTVTIKNDGNQAMVRLEDTRITLGLFTGTTLLWSAQTSPDMTDLPSDTTRDGTVHVDYTTPGTYTLAIGLGMPGELPDINMPHSALTGHWYAIGTFTITQL